MFIKPIQTIKISERVEIVQLTAKRWWVMVDGRCEFNTHRGEKRARAIAKVYAAGHKA